jgi:hypothetical protein
MSAPNKATIMPTIVSEMVRTFISGQRLEI